MKRTLAALLVSVCLWIAGCEDDSNTTINEAPNIPAVSNGVLLIDGNTGTFIVYQTTTEGSDDAIVITDNTGKVYVVTRPYVPEPEQKVE